GEGGVAGGGGRGRQLGAGAGGAQRRDRQLQAVRLDDLQQLAEPRIVRYAGADEADTTVGGILREVADRVAQRGDAAMTNGTVDLALEAEPTAAAASLAHLEERHVPVFGVRRLHERDRLEAIDVRQPALDDDGRRPRPRQHRRQRAIGVIGNVVAAGDVY